MTLVELLVALIFIVGTLTLVAGHRGGRLFDWLIDHRPVHTTDEGTGHDPQQRKHGNLRL